MKINVNPDQYRQNGEQNKKENGPKKEQFPKDFVGRVGTLVIEEDTVYEIDEECINCRKAKMR